MAHPIHPVPPRLSILRRREVEARTGLSRSTIYLRVAAGSFPSPINLGGGRAIGWVEEEIQAWIQQQVAVSRKAINHPLAHGERDKVRTAHLGISKLLADGESAKTA